jgi:hypothetical protein
MTTNQELCYAIKREIVAQGEGRWKNAAEMLLGLNIWSHKDLMTKALRFLLANVDMLIEEYDAED